MRRAPARGFTLVEVATVVVIVGVLAVIGTVVFTRYRAQARLAEATGMTAGIRTAQESYRQERGVYARVSRTVSDWYPATSPGSFVTAWGGACAACDDADGWKHINVMASEPVMYGYATVSGVGDDLAGLGVPTGAGPEILAAASSAGATGPSRNALNAASVGAVTPYYVTVAWGDTNADGKPSIVMSYSMSTQLFVQTE